MKQKYTVLIVDDQVESIKLINNILKSEYFTLFAKDSNSAIRMIVENLPDLILLDIQMPDIDGYTLCQQIKENPSISDIPVIFVTANTDIGFEKKGFETGAVDYITKPVNPEILKARVSTQIKLRMAVNAANQANQAKSQFLASMSHEIRTPLNAVLGMTELSLHHDLNDDLKENLCIVRDSANHLMDIINDILDISKIEAGKIELECVDFDIVDLIQSVLRTFMIQAQKNALYLEFDNDDTAPRYAKGDPVRLKQILVNLVGNAIKFTSKGGITVKVSGNYHMNMINYTISVADTGIGISQDKLVSIFDSFSQADKSTTRKYGGTGLGLNISKQLIALMGGNISVESTLEKGTTFYVYVSLDKGDEKVILDQLQAIESKCPVITDSDILVIDDNATNLRVAEKFLTEFGYKPHVTTNVHEAFEMMTNLTFDLIFMDIEMPEMDGIEATRLIRSGKLGNEIANIPIVAMTAHAISTFEQKCIDAGMNDYITKPINFHELKLLIERLMTTSAQYSTRVANKKTKKGRLQVLNKKRAMFSLGGDEKFFRSLLSDFTESIHNRVEKISDGIVKQDYKDIRLQAHSLKSEAGTVGAEFIYEMACNLENSGKNQSDDNHLWKLFGDLQNEVNRFLNNINKNGVIS
jgi:signal transduction histidine kinase/HPt (histidine-containing phosphotransfer) domain-containing protein